MSSHSNGNPKMTHEQRIKHGLIWQGEQNLSADHFAQLINCVCWSPDKKTRNIVWPRGLPDTAY